MNEHIVEPDEIIDLMVDYDFKIISVTNTPDASIVLVVKHDLHPEIEANIILNTIPETEDGEEVESVMNITFEGPDDYTDEEARLVLREVSDFLVAAIEKAVELPEVEGDEDDEDEDEDEGGEANEQS
jgi:hypothetical protein